MARGRTALYREKAVFDVIRGGRAAGRNVRDICRDLEEYINKPNGGEIVAGRWGNMFPATKEGIRDAYMHQYVEGLGLQWGSTGAHNILYEKTPGGATRLREGFRQYLDERMSGIKYDEKTGLALRGSKLPDAVKQYAARLGKAGLDYQTIRIARTETTAMLADEQLAIAGNSDICTGEMDFVMERGRDAWPCNCEKYASKSPWKVDDPERPEIPVHPNCMCEWRPRLKTDAEILASLREEMKADLETFEGTEEQKELLERIDEMEKQGQSSAISVNLSQKMQELIDSENVELSNMNEEMGKEVYSKIDSFYNKYPDMKGLVTSIDEDAEKYNPGENPFMSMHSDTGEMHFNKKYTNLTREQLGEIWAIDSKNGFHPPNTTWQSAIDHEIGHAIEAHIRRLDRANPDRAYNWTLSDMFNPILESLDVDPLDRKKVRKYLLENLAGYLEEFRGDQFYKEAFAEAFSEYTANPTTARPFAVALGKAIEPYLAMKVNYPGR
jgi:hypothetical protein